MTQAVFVGKVQVGGGAPVSIQSMCNTPTSDVQSTLLQINELAKAGCEIIRVAVPDMTAADALPQIVEASPLPVVADIHFDYRLALASIAAGAAAIRVNPGNLGGEDAVKAVAQALLKANIPVRVGANSGSLSKENQARLAAAPDDLHNAVLSDALVESVLEQAQCFERYGVSAIKVSLKASNVPATVMAYKKFAQRSDYPLHIGVTEAGTPARGIVKSAAGIGALLLNGLGDTIRVSLTADPIHEVTAGLRILESVGLRPSSPDIVSCPTCGRTKIDLVGLAEKVELLINRIKAEGKTIALKKVAVMGCVVNGPGEARDADLGIAGGDGKVVLFKQGEICGTYSETEGFARLESEIRSAVK